MNLHIAQIKTVPLKGKLDENHRTLLTCLERIGAGIDVVVTPECFLDGYGATEEYVTGESIIDYAVDANNSPYVREVSSWAKANHTWVVLGCTRAAEGDSFNSALAIDRDGGIAFIYDKVHCQTHDQKFVAGGSLPVFESDFGTFGMMICADRRWPETVRTLAIKGAQIIFTPTYGMHDELNLMMMRTRSYESEVYIAFTHPKQSLVTDPRGDIVVYDDDESTDVVTCDVDLLLADKVRAGASSHLKDRRPDVYA